MKLFHEIVKPTKHYESVVLMYSSFFWLSGNDSWFCRVWNGLRFGQSYGKNKYAAYRAAVRNLNS